MSPPPASLAGLVALLALAQAGVAQPAPIAPAANAPGAVKLVGRSVDKANEFGKRADGSHNPDFMRKDFAKMVNKHKKAQAAAGAVAKRGVEKRAAKAKAAASSTSINLNDEIQDSQDIEYYGNVAFGTPAQTFPMDFDTGSADTWIPVKKIAGSAGYFNPAKSSTYSNSKKKFTISYDQGASGGTIATDAMTVGSLTVASQAFGAVTSESSDWNGDDAAGLVGLAFSSISSIGKPTFTENLISQGKLASPLFAISLRRNQKSGSELTIGAVDSSRYKGSIQWNSLTSQTYWQVKGQTVVNGKKVGSTFNAAIDSGTTYMFLPTAVAKAVFAQIPGASRNSAQSSSGYNVYQFPCKSTATVGFSFSGGSAVYYLNAADLSAGTVGKASAGMCISTITGYDLEGLSGGVIAVLGDSFMKNVYSVFRYKSGSSGAAVGFATVA